MGTGHSVGLLTKLPFPGRAQGFPPADVASVASPPRWPPRHLDIHCICGSIRSLYKVCASGPCSSLPFDLSCCFRIPAHPLPYPRAKAEKARCLGKFLGSFGRQASSIPDKTRAKWGYTRCGYPDMEGVRNTP